MSPTKRAVLWLMAAFYVANGVNHFISTDVHLQIIPDFVPLPLAVVYLSGVAEILLGVGVLFGPTRVMAAWGLVILLAVVFRPMSTWRLTALCSSVKSPTPW
jgi:uncharacterized membrane protein